MRILVLFIISTLSFSKPMLAENGFKVDSRSAHMGAIGSLSEMIRLDVKTLGLGAPVSSAEIDIILPTVKSITERNKVNYYREPDFLVTDLYPAEVTEGKEVIVIYKGDTLDKYLALKEEKARLVGNDAYDAAARKKIAYAFGKLLSYPDHTILNLMSQKH